MPISRIFERDNSHYLTVNGAVTFQNIAERYSVVQWYIEVTRTSPGYYSATKGWGYESSAGVSDVTWDADRLWRHTDMSYDWRGPERARRYRLAQGAYRIYHDDNGNANYFLAGYVRVPILGGAWAGPEHRSAPNIGPLSQPPRVTHPVSLDLIDQTSMRYRFYGTGDGGSPIREWQIGYGTDPYTAQYFFKSNSAGDPIIGNLAPATRWYVWSRGRNDRGWGPWSPPLSARTLAGAWLKVNGVWKEAVPYVKTPHGWKLARPYVKTQGLWKPGQ